MLRFGIFAPKSQVKNGRSKSLDHLNSSRSNEWKKEGRFTRFRRSLSFSDRHNGNKNKNSVLKEKVTDENRSKDDLSRRCSAPLYPMHNGLPLAESSNLHLNESQQGRLTYSCCDLRSGNNFHDQHAEHLSRQHNRATKHRSLLLEDYSTFPFYDDSISKKEIGVVKPLTTSKDYQALPNDNHSILWHRNGNEQAEIMTKLHAAKSVPNLRQDNKNNHNKYQSSQDTGETQIEKNCFCQNISGGKHISRSSLELSQRSSLALNPLRSLPGQESSNCECCQAVPFCACRLHAHEHYSNKNEETKVTGKGNTHKKYVIVKRHYTNPKESQPSYQNKESTAVVSGKHLYRAKSEGSLAYRNNEKKNHAVQSGLEDTLSGCYRIPRQQFGVSRGDGALSSVKEETRVSELRENESAFQVTKGRSVMETSIDDVLPHQYHQAANVNTSSPVRNSVLKNDNTKNRTKELGKNTNCDFEISNVTNNGQVPKEGKQLLEETMTQKNKVLSESNESSNQVHKEGKTKRWRKKKKRKSAPAAYPSFGASEDSAEKTFPLLHIAAKEGDLTLMRTLIDIGVDLDEEDQDGWPAIHHAIQAGQFEAAGLLIENGGCLSLYTDKVVHEYCTAVRTLILKRKSHNK